MLLVLDIGNSNIVMGAYDGAKLLRHWRISTDRQKTGDEYGILINELFHYQGLSLSDIQAVIISSVVPPLVVPLRKMCERYFHIRPLIVGPGIRTGIRLNYENPRSIGADRIVNTTYAWNTFHRSCIIVDFGTATTYDYIDQNGVFRYVVIQPGLGISLNALTSMTAKLPEIEIVKPKSVLGTNTIEGMQAGVVYGYIGSVEYIIKTMKKELNDSSCMVIATGGLGKIIANETDEIDAYDADIAYKGMKILYEINKGNEYENL